MGPTWWLKTVLEQVSLQALQSLSDKTSYVMLSSKMSLNSNKMKIRAIFRWKPHQNWTFGSRDIIILVLLKTIKYRENLMLLPIVS